MKDVQKALLPNLGCCFAFPRSSRSTNRSSRAWPTARKTPRSSALPSTSPTGSTCASSPRASRHTPSGSCWQIARATRRRLLRGAPNSGETLAAWLHTIGRQTMIGARGGRWLVNHPIDSPANQSSKADSGRRAAPRRQRCRPSRRFRPGRRFAPAHVSRGLARCHHLRPSSPTRAGPHRVWQTSRRPAIATPVDARVGLGADAPRDVIDTLRLLHPQENPTVRRRRPDATDLEPCRRSPRCHGYFPIVAAAAIRPVLLLSPSMKEGPLSSPSPDVVRVLTTSHCDMPGERCRVKRLSKLTGVNRQAHGA